MDRPNVLLITTDQQRFDALACSGNPDIYTPHLDWLAHEGVTYSRAYADCPACIPSRATIMTGRPGYATGLTTMSGDIQPMVENPTLPGLLTQAGYQTRAQGKMHFLPMRTNHGFEHMELPFDYIRDSGAAVVGNPDRCIEVAKRYEAAGCDLLLCLLNPYDISHEATMRSIELLGKHVIPELDRD